MFDIFAVLPFKVISWSKSLNGKEFNNKYDDDLYLPFEFDSLKSLYNVIWKYGVFNILDRFSPTLTYEFKLKIFSTSSVLTHALPSLVVDIKPSEVLTLYISLSDISLLVTDDLY